MLLIGRKREQKRLKQSWGQVEDGEPQLAVVWGRRRVGKTFLLTHFSEGKRSLYFTATRQDTEARQLQRFTERLQDQLGLEIAERITGPFPDWEAALRFIGQISRDEPLLVVLDEVPRLNSTAGDFGDLLSAFWENHIHDNKLMLVVSGSAVAVMEHMLGPQGGLHRRPHLELRLDPFTFREAAQFLPELNGDSFLQAYAACGGYPLHLRSWDQEESVNENLQELAFSPGGILLRDAPDIMSEDLDWRGGYERVLAAMSGGPRRRSKIAGRAQQRIDYTLDRLYRAGYVERVRSIGVQGNTDPMYEISDDYLAYWFSVLRDDADLIDGGQGAAVSIRTEGKWNRHIARVMESAAIEHTRQMVEEGILPREAIVGRWWKDEIAEVDVCALMSDGRPALVGECKWHTKPMSNRELSELRRKAVLIVGGSSEINRPEENDSDRSGVNQESPVFAMWARGGAALLAAEYKDVWSFTCDDLLP